MWEQLRAEIKTALESVGSIKTVSAYPKASHDVYPAVEIHGSEHESDFGTFGPAYENMHTAAFIVRAVYLLTDETMEEAEAKLDKVLDDMLTLFGQPNVLASADWVEPTGGTWGYQDRGGGTARTAELRIRCKKLKA